MTREEWLQKAVRKLAPLLAEVDAPVPDDVQVSCSFPHTSIRKRRAECWTRAAGQGVHQIFMSPLYDDAALILAILLHELIHAWDDCESGHRGAFMQKAKALGLVAPFTTATPNEELAEKLVALAHELGDYPHRAVVLGDVKKQTTRMVKLVCQDDGYILRTTQKWIEFGMPSCACGLVMEVAE